MPFFRNGRSILLLIFLLASAHSMAGFEISYWAWQREDPLDEHEMGELAVQNVRTIYWQIGELENTGETWRWKARFSFPSVGRSGMRFVPVVRLVSREREPFTAASLGALLTALAPAAKFSDELQLDYDAPDRLLGEYGRALKKIHELTPRLTITALPHWSSGDCINQLQASVDEFLPMLYDYEAEPVLRDNAPLPLISPEKMARMLQAWSKCGKPWRAGLPAFARLTVYEADGKSRGQIRNWNWDEVCPNPALLMARPTQLGAAVLKAQRTIALSNTQLRTGDQLVVRWADRDALQNAIAAAREKSAQGVVLFRLPDSTAASGWSLHQLGYLSARAQPAVSVSAQSLELLNRGDGDLEPRFSTNTRSGAYMVVAEADAPIFREAEPGDFISVTGYSKSERGMREVRIPFATQLVFRFSQLRAKQSLRTGLIQLAPTADFGQARLRFKDPEETAEPLKK